MLQYASQVPTDSIWCAGPEGPKGRVCEESKVGDQGHKSPKGERGGKGPKGVTGPQGKMGIWGERGVTGSERYEAWYDAGRIPDKATAEPAKLAA